MPRSKCRPRVLPARLVVACATATLAVVLACPARTIAQEVGSVQGTPEALQEPANLRLHGAVLAVGSATLATVGALQSKLAPSTCRWCDLHADGTDALNPLDRTVRKALLWEHPNTASTISNVLAFGAVPAVAIGVSARASRAEGRGGDIKADMLVIGEAAVLAGNAAELLKFATARSRPYAHARALGEAVGVAPQSSDNLSFASGHVAFAFAMTVSTAEVMTLRGHRRQARWVWGFGLPAAVATAYFRMAADRHYLTDVLASAGVGTALGLAVPHLVFKVRPAGPSAAARFTVAPLLSGSLFGVTCTW